MAMSPLADWLMLPEREAAERIPFVLAVDAEDRLHRVIIDMHLVQATRRCMLLWHRLQEHGGIHNSHAEQALAREKLAWDAARQQEPDALQQPAAAGVAAAAEPAAAEAAPATTGEPAPASDEPWIETSRCSSCNECQNINDKLFGYDKNKQAYIKDINAGTYKDLVEAAEACQVAIIHPGKPKNPNEPGLAELMERAQPFL
jgi:ferredoxin